LPCQDDNTYHHILYINTKANSPKSATHATSKIPHLLLYKLIGSTQINIGSLACTITTPRAIR